jgi:hypothetical protein
MTATHENLGVRGIDVSGDTNAIEGTVESASTRVLINGSGRECGVCDTTIATGVQHCCLTVRDSNGEVAELSICGEDCLKALKE